eukprot:3316527-Pyramimonas_sp.AAC.1
MVAADTFGNALGARPGLLGGSWGLAANAYVPAHMVEADVCGGGAYTDPTQFYAAKYPSTSTGRRLTQVTVTAAPTAGPTTAGPTTAGPTTAGPTTRSPTTSPTTTSPTTAAPTDVRENCAASAA